jgi:Dyp-type peroxidase family
MTELDLSDIQGIVTRAYKTLPSARFLLMRINDAESARAWLDTVAGSVTAAVGEPIGQALNVAFTSIGLTALGLDRKTSETFAFEFSEGMTAEHRRLTLGDHGDSDPDRWVWGGPNTHPVHILLMIYAKDDATLEGFQRNLLDAAAHGTLSEVGQLDTYVLFDRDSGCVKEHFGFCDGLSQPVIEGLKERGRPEYRVKAGEFLLGYSNEYGRLTTGPVAEPTAAAKDLLPEAPDEPGMRDLGRNGTYLVFRHLHQNVKLFWKTVDAATRQNGKSDADARTGLAAKMVGRWPGGAPLVNAPDRDRPELARDNDFGYHAEDPDGLRCPVGAHIRRSNPRDSLSPDPGTDKSIAVNRRHQLLRRGRTFGRPLASSLSPDDFLASDGTGDRGLYFICLGANISRQFEFVQQTWINNPKFGGLYEDTDPLIGDRLPKGAPTGGTFTVPEDPVRKRITGLPSFTQVSGGAYFFLPGIRALRYFASL